MKAWGALPALLVLGAAPAPPVLLIFSHSTGFRHESIPVGVAALREIASEQGMAVRASEDPGVFDADASLRGITAVALLSTTTDPQRADSEWFVGKRRATLMRFVRRGGGIVGVHAAADSHYRWPWFGRMIGARFASHPPGTPAGRLRRTAARHPATEVLPHEFARTDEWYRYKDRTAATVLLALDPASIGEAAGPAWPMAWVHEFEGGRVFYTGLGHTSDGFADPHMRAHLAGGLRWAARLQPAARPPTNRRAASSAKP